MDIIIFLLAAILAFLTFGWAGIGVVGVVFALYVVKEWLSARRELGL